ncbi:unnamed protein product [Diamesa serratosioi]
MGIECIICENNICPKDNDTFSTPCGHIFHELCIDKHLLTKQTCPCCNEICDIQEVFQLFTNLNSEDGEDEEDTSQIQKDLLLHHINEMTKQLKIKNERIAELTMRLTSHQLVKLDWQESEDTEDSATVLRRNSDLLTCVSNLRNQLETKNLRLTNLEVMLEDISGQMNNISNKNKELNERKAHLTKHLGEMVHLRNFIDRKNRDSSEKDLLIERLSQEVKALKESAQIALNNEIAQHNELESSSSEYCSSEDEEQVSVDEQIDDNAEKQPALDENLHDDESSSDDGEASGGFEQNGENDDDESSSDNGESSSDDGEASGGSEQNGDNDDNDAGNVVTDNILGHGHQHGFIKITRLRTADNFYQVFEYHRT